MAAKELRSPESTEYLGLSGGERPRRTRASGLKRSSGSLVGVVSHEQRLSGAGQTTCVLTESRLAVSLEMENDTDE